MSSSRLQTREHRTTTTTKSPALYLWIVGVAAILDGLMFWCLAPSVRQAWTFRPIAGIGAGVCTVFIAYFWLNGTKDIVYTLWYHLVMARRGPLVPPRRSSAARETAPRVVMVYCTCNDFADGPLSESMVQDYSNYEVVILDDSSSQDYVATVDDFARKHGLRVIRRPDRTGYKAGNLNHGLALLEFDYFVILDSDEVVPHDFIDRALDYFSDRPDVGIVQANHQAMRNRNPFMTRFSIGVNSHWWSYQTVKNEYAFMSLLGHGAMLSKECITSVGGFPQLVAEDICLSIEARQQGWLTVFAPDIMCEEEYPVDYLAFKKRHNKWTQGNMEFIKTYTKTIAFGNLSWFEKLDIVLFTYSLPLTALFSVYVAINVIAFPIMHYTPVYPLWMLAPTVLFLFAPMLNDVIFHWRRVPARELAIYLFQSTLLYGSMFFVSLRASVKSMVGGSVFLVTPKEDQRLSLGQALMANRVEIAMGLILGSVVVYLTDSLFGVLLIIGPSLFSAYMSLMHQTKRPDPVAESGATEPQ